MKNRKVILWFRQDLRLHDNEALLEAMEVSKDILPIYIFDERIFKGKTKFGFPKTNKYRCKFIIESVKDLRKSLQAKGSELIVRTGIPEDIIYEIANEIRSSWIFCNRERTQEEVDVQDTLENKLWSVGQEIRYSRGKMLYYTQDLPFPISHTPDVFTHFRKEVEKFIPVRESISTPEKINYFTPQIDLGQIPALSDFGWNDFEEDERSVLQFKGGETAALERLRYYLWDSKLVKNYKETRDGLLGGDYSSKFSPWLAQGCLSPKKIYAELKAFENEHGSNKSTYWLYFELLWRDFFRLQGKRHGNTIFQKGGIKKEKDTSLKNDMTLFHLWSEGRTGIPFIDANMRELNQTGFMSNRGRQNVASFLVKDLKVNWQIGAEYFESLLLDYDPCSNWGNWNYVAGVGSDPRENRYFNILSQAKRYDPDGEYVRTWLPELAEISKEKIHRPDTLSDAEQSDFHIKLGISYPKPMVKTSRWA